MSERQNVHVRFFPLHSAHLVPRAESPSDGAVAESITVETFESFDDLVSEAEAVPDDVELGRAPKAKAEVVEENERTKTVPRKRGRKKISFV